MRSDVSVNKYRWHVGRHYATTCSRPDQLEESDWYWVAMWFVLHPRHFATQHEHIWHTLPLFCILLKSLSEPPRIIFRRNSTWLQRHNYSRGPILPSIETLLQVDHMTVGTADRFAFPLTNNFGGVFGRSVAHVVDLKILLCSFARIPQNFGICFHLASVPSITQVSDYLQSVSGFTSGCSDLGTGTSEQD